MRVCLLAVSLVLAALASASANDSSMGGSGQDLIPERSSAVRMVSEDIRIVREQGMSEWSILAKYVFLNTSREPVALAMGFPEHRCDPDGDNDCNGDGHFREMRTLVRGAEVQHRIGAVSSRSPWHTELGQVFVFDVTFGAEESVTVEHAYKVSGGGSVYAFGLDYVTRTGRNWNGPIGHARFTVELPEAPSAVLENRAYPLLERRYTTGTRVEYVYEHRNWVPTQNFSFVGLHLDTLATAFECPTWADGPESGLQDASLRHWTDAQLRLCRNLPYAIHGMPFRDRALTRTFYGRRIRIEDLGARTIPLAADPAFAESRLRLEDHRYVRMIIAEERRRAGATP